jgi:hypothetical protein
MAIEVKNGRLYEKIAEMQLAVQPKSKAMRRVLTRIGIKLEGQIKRNIRRIDLIDTGTLLNSIRYELTSSGSAGILQVGSWGVPYARIHEYGGVIRPKRAKYLTIPISERSKGNFISDFDIRFFRNPKTDKLLAVDDVTGEPLFVLKKRVTIKAKRYMRDAIKKQTPFIYDTIRELTAP